MDLPMSKPINVARYSLITGKLLEENSHRHVAQPLEIISTDAFISRIWQAPDSTQFKNQYAAPIQGVYDNNRFFIQDPHLLDHKLTSRGSNEQELNFCL